MDKTSAQRIVLETFKASFDKKRYRDFINELCNGFDESKAISSMGVLDAFSDHIKSCQRLGTFESADGELADVLIVHLTESYKLERTRTALRDFVAHKLKRDESYKEAGLVAFVAPDLQWRFSYVRMEYETKRDPKTGKIKSEERLTPARRFSYLVGVDEECHTAQSRFLALLQNTNDKPTLAQIENAFSVESVTKEFFGEYARLFVTTEAALAALVEKDQALRDDFEAKHVNTADFTKKLLGQIVFLYFIQKKGWLGVAKGGNWGDGPRNFLRQLATLAIEKKQCLFNDVLEPLFYDTLATDRGHEAWCEPFQCRIPFLNGGLFEPLAGYDWENTEITLPNTLLTNRETNKAGDIGTGILDVFDRYNFTVMEDEPLEKEVAIDPEMLGKVFENLIEENRRKGLGTFYTPREIVHYMCQESLINYLDTALNHPLKPIGMVTPEPEQTQPLFVDSDEVPHAPTGQQEFLESTTRILASREELAEWIGQSDQFAHYAAAIEAGTKGDHYPKPSAAIRKYAREIDELLRDITVCDPAVGSGAFLVGMMTEIVRARMALTPYFNDVAERTAYHFKRRAIQYSLYGVDIDAGAVEIAKLRLWLSLVVDEEDVQQIKPLPNLDYKIVVGNSLLGVEKNLFNQGLFKRLEELKPKFFNESDRKKKAQFKKQIDDLIHELTNGREVFDYEIYFSEVFHAKNGFDVAIANPPYVDSEEMTRSSPALRKLCCKHFNSARGNWDLYVPFIELGLLKTNGCGAASFIVPNKILSVPYAKALRSILGEHHINYIRDYSSVNVFHDVAVYPVVLQVSHQRSTSDVRMQQMVSLVDADITNLIPVSLFESGDGWDRHFQVEGHGSLLDRFKNLPLLKEQCLSVASAATVGEAYLISDFMEDKEHFDPAIFKKFINTGTIDPFTSKWGLQNTRYIKNAYQFPVVSVKNLCELNRLRLEQANSEKLIIGGMNLKIECYHDQGEYLAGKSTVIILPNDKVPALYLAAVLNSNCVSYWYRTFFKSMSLAGGYLRIGHKQIGEIPIPKYEEQSCVELLQVANQLNNYPTDSNAWIRLEQLVCSLYDLTPDEIELIDAAH